MLHGRLCSVSKRCNWTSVQLWWNVCGMRLRAHEHAHMNMRMDVPTLGVLTFASRDAVCKTQVKYPTVFNSATPVSKGNYIFFF